MKSVQNLPKFEVYRLPSADPTEIEKAYMLYPSTPVLLPLNLQLQITAYFDPYKILLMGRTSILCTYFKKTGQSSAKMMASAERMES